MLIVALTGGIGSGKTLVSDAFAQKGVPVIDTDHIARELVQPGQPALEALVEAFGRGVLNADGSLNRDLLRQRVFESDAERTKLEGILHPRIEQEVRDRLAELQAPYCIVVVPLLIEKGGYAFVDRILVVDTARETQVQRTVQRDNMDPEAVERILDAQADRRQRLARADDVISNDGDKAHLRAQVDQLHHTYLQLAGRTD